jgi:hypothetical protein
VSHIRRPLALAIAGLALLVAPGIASAAVVTNGDFETGDLSGWHLDNSPPASSPTFDTWFVYSGTTIGSGMTLETVAAPPQGNFAAIDDQGGPGRRILYQDIALPPGGSQYMLNLIAYYQTLAAIASPNSLNPAVTPNEQYRIDVMKPTAPIDSVDASDILLTVFRTLSGDPQTLAPTQKTADLSAYAGQTVRLRFAEVDNQDVFNASVDAVSVNTNAFTIGTATLNKKKGTATVPLTLPDPGDVTVSGTGVKGNLAATSAVAAGAGTVNVVIKATGKKKKKLNKKGKVKLNATITFTPTGLSPVAQNTKVKLKKKTKKK